MPGPELCRRVLHCPSLTCHFHVFQGSIPVNGTLTAEPWGAAGAGGMAFIDEGLVLFHVEKCLPSLSPHPSDASGIHTRVPFPVEEVCLGGGSAQNSSAVFLKEQAFGVLELYRPEAYVFQ